MKLFYTHPARRWEETIPIGNGRLGAMIWGDPSKECLGLNEDSIWSGYAHDKNNHEAFPYLQHARELIMQAKYGEAEDWIRDHMLGEYCESYLPLGNLEFQCGRHQSVSDYRRELDIDRSIASVSYIADGHRYTREYFSSYPSQAIFIRFTCDRPLMDYRATFTSQLKSEIVYEEGSIGIHGQCPEHVDPQYVDTKEPVIQGAKGMRFHAGLHLRETDGVVSHDEESLHITNASTIVFAFSSVKPARFSSSETYEQLKEKHIRDYKSLYDKVELYLGEQPEIPTDERLERLREGSDDSALFALYFQYGRYMLISSSRAGGLPANLQGIWSWEMRAPWSSNWTTNINLQMNYWPAQVCNLQECLPPYFDLLKKICVEGKKTAQIHYHCRGFVAHHNLDYWCNANPVGIAHGDTKGNEEFCVTWSFWTMGGAWLTSELFKQYEYHPDQTFLKETVYPILKEAALFLVDWVYEQDGQYVTCPSTSPENRFQTSDGATSSVAMSSAMDLALIREVFGNFQKTCSILDIQDEILPEIEERLEHLAPFQTGSYGQMLEWNKEFDEVEPGHRHISHLYGLFPSELFAGDVAKTEACRISLMNRLKNGGGYTGWSCAWIINMFAVLEDSEHAFQYLKELLAQATYDNLWGKHPPFQIDANFGGTAAIANMLVQDRNGTVKLLPALPKSFSNGYVKGLRIKGGKTVDIQWENGILQSSRIY